MDKIMLIDGNSILNRAFYGLQKGNMLATSYGLYTNAVYGFLSILNRYLEEENPQYICVAFDLKAPTFRHEEFDGYKAKRKGMPQELVVQVPIIKEVLDAMNIKRIECSGFEADDIIGAVSALAHNNGLETIIITGDRDALQLINDSIRVKIPKTKAGKTETEEYTVDRIVNDYGITPEEFIDLKGLMGDQSDNIPGVPGVGEKTALELIREFKSIENLYENLDSVTKPTLKQKLLENQHWAFLSKRLATIKRSIPCDMQIEDFERKEFDKDALLKIFTRLEFKSLIAKYALEQDQGITDEKKSFNSDFEQVRNLTDLENLVKLIYSSLEFSFYHVVEKNSDQNSLVGIAITVPDIKDRNFFINLIDCGDEFISELEFIKRFKAIFEDDKISKYGHNVKNFIVYLENYGISLNGFKFDTMIGSYILNPSKDQYPVSGIAIEYLKIYVDSIEEFMGKGKNFTPCSKFPQDKLSKICTLYSEVILKAKDTMHKMLEENNQIELYYKIELPLIFVLADMEYQGFKVDVNVLDKLFIELESKISLLEKEIIDLAGEKFNINSPKQLGEILFNKLKLPVIKKTKTGFSTDVEVLEELSDKHEIVEKILEYRQLIKLKTTYVDGLRNVINPKTGKIHSSFNQTVTVTGRISSTDPNLQNIPIKLDMGRKIRKVFIPTSEDYFLVDADYSQVELRILAHITQDKNMINAFKNNEDIHTTTAANIFGVEKSEVTSLMRARAKAVNFGIVYGIGEFSLAKDLKITKLEAKKYIDEYFNKYPNVKEYMHNVIKTGKNNGYVTTLFNRRRYLPELSSSNFNIRSFGERIAMNMPIQGTAADIMKIAMVNVYETLKNGNFKSRLILQVHDELIIEAYKDEKDEVERILKDCMEHAVSFDIPLDISIHTGSSWYETK